MQPTGGVPSMQLQPGSGSQVVGSEREHSGAQQEVQFLGRAANGSPSSRLSTDDGGKGTTGMDTTVGSG